MLCLYLGESREAKGLYSLDLHTGSHVSSTHHPLHTTEAPLTHSLYQQDLSPNTPGNSTYSWLAWRDSPGLVNPRQEALISVRCLGGPGCPTGLEASWQHLSAMDYLFGIVVLLCGALQPGRGVEPKHNVPRLKLSYKGKPSLHSTLTPGYLGHVVLLT